MNPKRLFRYIAIAIAALLVYGNTLTLKYASDDRMLILENDYTLKGYQGIGDVFTKDSFTGYFGEDGQLVAGGRYRPMSQLTFIAEYEWFGGDLKQKSGLHRDPKNEELFSQSALPVIQHAMNIIWYILLCFTLLAVLQKLFPALDHEKWYRSLPFIATLLFLLHPLHTEAVANIKGRDEILCMLGSLLSLYCSILYIEKKKWWWLLLAFLAMCFAVFSKENAITFLAVIPLALYFLPAEKRPADYVLTLVLPLLAAGLFLAARTHALGGFMNTAGNDNILNNPFAGQSKGTEIATTLFTWAIYFRLMLFPHPLTHDYYPNQIDLTGFANPIVILVILAVIGLLWLAIRGLKEKSPVSFAILFFFITFSITSNLLFNVGTFMNERFVFAPLLGFVLILAFLIQKLASKQLSSRWTVTLLAVIGLLYGGKTFARNFAWKDDITLFTTDVQVSNKSQKCCLSAGGSYMKLYLRETKPRKKSEYLRLAEKYLTLALKLGRSDSDTYSLLGQLYFYKGDYIAAAQCYRAILNSNPTDEETLRNLAAVGNSSIMRIGQLIEDNQVDEALKLAQSALKDQPNSPDVLNLMGRIYGEKLGQLDQSIQYLEQAVTLNPDHASAQENLGIAYAMSGRYNDAIRCLEHALEIEPTNARIMDNLANVYHSAGKNKESIAMLTQAIQAEPTEARQQKLDSWTH